MRTNCQKYVRTGFAIAIVAGLPLWAQAAKKGAAAKSKPSVEKFDRVVAVDLAQSTVTIYDHLIQSNVTYTVTTNTEIFLLHNLVSLEQLKPDTKVTVTPDANPSVAARIDGVDQPPKPKKPAQPAKKPAQPAKPAKKK